MTRQFYTLVAVRLLGSVQTPHRAFKSDYHFLRSRYRYHQINSSANPARFDKKMLKKYFYFSTKHYSSLQCPDVKMIVAAAALSIRRDWSLGRHGAHWRTWCGNRLRWISQHSNGLRKWKERLRHLYHSLNCYKKQLYAWSILQTILAMWMKIWH